MDPVLIAAHTARTRWLALHCFLALLWASADVDESLHALWATRDGLEFSPSSPGRPGSAALGPRALRVETACVWLVRAGKQMYAAKGIWGPRGDDGWDTKKGAPGKGGELWDGVDGYDKGRWAVWKKSLEDIINERDVGTNVVEAAKVHLPITLTTRNAYLLTVGCTSCDEASRGPILLGPPTLVGIVGILHIRRGSLINTHIQPYYCLSYVLTPHPSVTVSLKLQMSSLSPAIAALKASFPLLNQFVTPFPMPCESHLPLTDSMVKSSEHHSKQEIVKRFLNKDGNKETRRLRTIKCPAHEKPNR